MIYYGPKRKNQNPKTKTKQAQEQGNGRKPGNQLAYLYGKIPQ